MPIGSEKGDRKDQLSCRRAAGGVNSRPPDCGSDPFQYPYRLKLVQEPWPPTRNEDLSLAYSRLFSAWPSKVGEARKDAVPFPALVIIIELVTFV